MHIERNLPGRRATRVMVVISVCRSDCFSSDIFVGCMDTLLVEKEARMEAANLVEDMHSYDRY